MEYLVKKAQQGDQAAFTELIKQNTQSLYKVARSYLNSEEDIADAIQDTILVCFEKIHGLKEARYFKTWLTRILINKCNDILKQGKRMVAVEDVPEKVNQHSYEDELVFEDLMHFLDDKYRIVLTLYYVERFKTSEIAQILEVSENTVKTRLVRGRKEFAYHYYIGDEKIVGGGQL
ncbi:MAG: sigma-70 family RNA polymerase sigma factor [Hespellia sp.]|nr:sigma-70 family RNA polymerase sigma factor [Hespellia sp.]